MTSKRNENFGVGNFTHNASANKKKKRRGKKKIKIEKQKRSLSKVLDEKSTEEEPARKRLRKDVKFLLNGQEKSNEMPPVFGELSEEQKKQVKRLLEERSKKRLARPYLTLTEVGEAADLKTQAEKRVPLKVEDIQDLIIYSLFPSKSIKGPSRFLELSKHESVKRRIFLLVEGAGLAEYLENEQNLTALKEFEARLEVVSSLSYGANLIEDIALVPMSRTQRNKLITEFGSLKNAADAGEIFQGLRRIFNIAPKSSEKSVRKIESGTPLICPDKFSRKKLLLSPWEMFDENYPLPCGSYGDRFKDFVPTRDEYSEVKADSPMWSVDCEMCLTSAGNELTRICIVNESHDIVYETLVKPHNPIINYLTQYSGITPELLSGVKTRLEDVQQHIRAICPPDVIFIGQSLNNDLIALKMFHPFVIDTSVIFNLSGIRHRKSKLSVLTEEFLSERIQLDKSGHSPIEDALAAMKLVQKKLQHYLSWGNAVLSGPRSEKESMEAQELLRIRQEAGVDRLRPLKELPELNNQAEQEELLSKSLFSHLTREKKTVQLVGKVLLIDGWWQYMKPSKQIKVQEVRTDRLGVKEVKKNSPTDISIVHISLNSQSPLKAITKADKLVHKLLRDPEPNTLYTVLLAGRPGCPGNGLLFIHLFREHVPLVSIPPS